jgi:hypothetical protein
MPHNRSQIPIRPNIAVGSFATDPFHASIEKWSLSSGLDDDSVAAQALEEGAQHYFVKSEVATRGLSRPLHYDSFLKRIMKW